MWSSKECYNYVIEPNVPISYTTLILMLFNDLTNRAIFSMNVIRCHDDEPLFNAKQSMVKDCEAIPKYKIGQTIRDLK